MSENKHGITIVGLGPGDVKHLTREAAEVLESSPRLYVRTEVHPTIPAIRKAFPRLDLRSFDRFYESSSTFEEVYGQIVKELVSLAQDADVLYGVPGSPSVDETTVRLLLGMAEPTGRPVRLIQGVSFLEPVLALVGNVDTTWLTVLDATEIALYADENATGEVAGRPGRLPWREPLPTVPLLVSQVHSRHVAVSVKLWLGRYWPDEHEVIAVKAAGTREQAVTSLPIHRLDRIPIDHLTAVFVPPLQDIENVRTFSGVMNITRTLRAPGGCPWDREQTHQSLKTHLLEEAYEVIAALDDEDHAKLVEELGDLLFQVTIHSQIAAEHDEFDIEDVFGSITTKLIRRHPHVFEEMELQTASDVLRHWETFKQQEQPERESILSGIPRAMPALPFSYAVQKRVASQGFEWPDMQSLLSQVHSEVDELAVEVDQDSPRERLVDELGDILFALVSVGRRLRIDPEDALRTANRKFVRRFRQVEDICKANQIDMRALQPEQLDDLWQGAKGVSNLG